MVARMLLNGLSMLCRSEDVVAWIEHVVGWIEHVVL